MGIGGFRSVRGWERYKVCDHGSCLYQCLSVAEAGSFYGTVGLNWITNGGSVSNFYSNPAGVQFSNAPILANLGVQGYEYRSDANFLVRGTGYVFIAQNFKPWVGLSVGFAF